MRGLWATLESGGLALTVACIMLVLAVGYGLYTNYRDASPPVQEIAAQAPAQ